MSQNFLANTLQSIGEGEPGTARLREASAAYSRALSVRSIELNPIDWALSTFDLGRTLLLIGERDSDAAALREAHQAFRDSLRGFEAFGFDYHDEIAELVARVEAAIAALD